MNRRTTRLQALNCVGPGKDLYCAKCLGSDVAKLVNVTIMSVIRKTMENVWPALLFYQFP